MSDQPLFYDPYGRPFENVLEWAFYFEHSDLRIVKQTRHKERGREFVLSTVWIGVDHSFGDGPPLLYETMVFDLEPPAWNDVIGVRHGDEQVRYATRDEAEAGHDPWKMTSRGVPRDFLRQVVEALR